MPPLDEARPLKSDQVEVVTCDSFLHERSTFGKPLTSKCEHFTLHLMDTTCILSWILQHQLSMSLSAKRNKTVSAYLGILKLGLDVRLHSSDNITFEALSRPPHSSAAGFP